MNCLSAASRTDTAYDPANSDYEFNTNFPFIQYSNQVKCILINSFPETAQSLISKEGNDRNTSVFEQIKRQN